MGRRLPTQIFLPNKWVFPGGRVDDADHTRAAHLSALDGTAPYTAAHLPFVAAAVRETFEEAGIEIAAFDAGDAATALTPLARAITPPGLPRRFDTWFYIADWDCARLATGTPDGELLDLGWFTIDQIRDLDLPLITRLVVDDVAIVTAAAPDPRPALVPFYFQSVDGYRRTLISPSAPWPQP